VEFRSWLLKNCLSRYVARKSVTYFHTVLAEIPFLLFHSPVNASASNFFYCGIRDELLALGSRSKTEKHLTMRINMARFLPPGALESSGATGQRALGEHC
jgi:hypothetical protein